MQEGTVTVSGKRYELSKPFFVLATQNPIEQEGTYPLPEAQLDRFLFKLVVGYSTRDELNTIVDRTTRGTKIITNKIMDGEEIRRWQALGSRSHPGQARARLHCAFDLGHASARAAGSRDHQSIHPLGQQPSRAQLSHWPPKCELCWTAATT